MDPTISETVELKKAGGVAAEKYFVKSAIDLAFEFGAASHAGLCRTENQDHYLIFRPRTYAGVVAIKRSKGRAGSSAR